MGRGARNALLVGIVMGVTVGRVRADGPGARAVGLAGTTETAKIAAERTGRGDDDGSDRDTEDDDAPDRAAATERHHYDYSRFSDGPRRVPRRRGASLRRATALGLGTHEVAHRLLHASPDPRWVEAAPGTLDGHLAWPVDLGRFGRGFGYVRRTRPDKRHDGVDIVADEGSEVRAAADGIVVYSDNEVRGFGNFVIVVHPNGWVTTYAHLYRATVQPGWRVHRGERIGFVGTTGISRGPHLHFELHVNGRAVDPLSRFEGRPWIAAYREWQRRLESGTYAPPTAHLQPGTPERPRTSHTAASTPQPPGPATTPPRRGADELGLARSLLDHGATAAQVAAVDGPLYSSLLWPARGGQLRGPFRGSQRGLTIDAERGTPIRAAADGLVVYVGDGLRGVGLAVVLLHRNGWVTVYGSTARVHVRAGEQVQRGAWIAEVGSSAGGPPHLYFQLRDGGTVRDPEPLLVQTPAP